MRVGLAAALAEAESAAAAAAEVVAGSVPVVVAEVVAPVPVPTLFVAVTVKEYAVRGESPVTVQVVVGGVVAQVAPPGVTVTVYAVTAGPPFGLGAAQVTAAVVSPAATVTDCGAPGATWDTNELIRLRSCAPTKTSCCAFNATPLGFRTAPAPCHMTAA